MMHKGTFSQPTYGGGSFDRTSANRAMFWGQPRGEIDSHGRGYTENRSHSPYNDRRKREDQYRSKEKLPPPEYEAEKKKSGMSDLIADFAGNTSLQALPFVFRKDKPFPKLFWSIIFIGALGATVFQFYLVLSKFYKFETTTKVIIGYDNLDFPSISICNLNPIRRSRLDDFVKRENESELLNGVRRLKNFFDQFKPLDKFKDIEEEAPGDGAGQPVPSPPPPPTPPPIEQIDGFGLTENKPPPFERFDESDDSWDFTSGKLADHAAEGDRLRVEAEKAQDDHKYGSGAEDPHARVRQEFHSTAAAIHPHVRAILGHSLDIMMLECVFNGKVCLLQNFTGHLDANYGNCYTFNTYELRNESLRVLNSGVDAGLNLLMYVETREHLGGIAEGKGLRVDIHPFQTMPFLWQDGISIPVGFQTYVGIGMTNYSRMGKPYHDCHTDEQFKADFNLSYTKEACINTCQDRLIAERCKCFRPEVKNLYNNTFLESEPKPHPCNSAKELECVYGIVSRRDSIFSRCNCLDACQETQYDVQTSSSVWPDITLWVPMVEALGQLDPKYGAILNGINDKTDQEKILRDNFLYLRIFYRDLTYQTIQEEAEYDQEQFLSDLGGTAGLYLGASVITFLELFELFLSCCTTGCCGSGKRKHKSRRDDDGFRGGHKQLRHGWTWRRGQDGPHDPRDGGDRSRGGSPGLRRLQHQGRDERDLGHGSPRMYGNNRYDNHGDRQSDSIPSDWTVDNDDRPEPGQRRPLPDNWRR